MEVGPWPRGIGGTVFALQIKLDPEKLKEQQAAEEAAKAEAEAAKAQARAGGADDTADDTADDAGGGSPEPSGGDPGE